MSIFRTKSGLFASLPTEADWLMRLLPLQICLIDYKYSLSRLLLIERQKSICDDFAWFINRWINMLNTNAGIPRLLIYRPRPSLKQRSQAIVDCGSACGLSLLVAQKVCGLHLTSILTPPFLFEDTAHSYINTINLPDNQSFRSKKIVNQINQHHRTTIDYHIKLNMISSCHGLVVSHPGWIWWNYSSILSIIIELIVKNIR